jgi:predicted dehydrogenase
LVFKGGQMKQLKVGIAGFGVVGKRRKMCLDNNPNSVVVGVCDKNFPSNGFTEDGIPFYPNYYELLENNLDILVVCMTNEIASEVTIAGIKAGLNVFCEKPPGRNVKDIQDVIEEEKKHSDIKLMYGFNHRYHESVKDAIQILESGDLGNIINMRGVYGKAKLVTFDQSDWRTKREIAGGGVLLDQGIHMVDLMRLFAGEFTQVYSFISNKYWKFDVEDNAYALMKTDNGIISMLNSSATQWRHQFTLDINLERGSIVLKGILSGTKSYGAETMTITSADPDNDMGDPREQTNKYNHDFSWQNEIDNFIEAIIFNKPIESGSSDDALKTMELVYKIYQSDLEWAKKYNI